MKTLLLRVYDDETEDAVTLLDVTAETISVETTLDVVPSASNGPWQVFETTGKGKVVIAWEGYQDPAKG